MRSFISILALPLLVFSTGTVWASTDLHKLIESAPLDGGVSTSIHAAQLTHYLEQNGYILATVSVAEDGDLQVDPGFISSVNIIGLRPKNEAHARQVISSTISQLPTEDQLDRAITLINDMPGVNASFAIERDEMGNYELYVSGKDISQFGGVSIDNTPTNIGDEYRINLHQNFNGLITGGDILRLQAVWLDGENSLNQRSVLGSYQLPIGANGGFAEFGASDFRTETEVHGRSTAYATGFGTVILPGRITSHDYEGQNYYINGGFPLRRSHDEAFYLLGQVDYSVDETDSIGKSDVLHGDVGLFYSHQRPTGESVHAGAFIGAGYNDSYIAGEDNNYWSAEFAASYITPVLAIDRFTELRIEGVAKVSGKHLPNSKLFGLGGEDFLRGYEASTYVGNSGIAATIELAHAYYFDNRYISRVAPYIFLDAGLISSPSEKSNTTNRPSSDELLSAGLGANVVLFDGLSAEGYLGVPLLEDASGNVPNPAIYFRLGWSW